MQSQPETAPDDSFATRGGAGEVFRVFLRLGLTSFGGPIAHLGYFREEFVARRGWLSDASFAQLLSLCQFLPGPASSQMGVAIGLFRAGGWGALAAFVGFTAPSMLLMLCLAVYAPRLFGHAAGAVLVHGLKLVAVVVVAHGLIGMVRMLTPDARRVAIAAGACALVLAAGGAGWQLLAIAAGGALGAWLCPAGARDAIAPFPVAYARRTAAICALLFLAALAGSLLLSAASPSPSPGGLASAFYRSGALVFGGGHVVLPLLERELVGSGWMSIDTFLTGYGAAQAMPGPMFSLAAYLGASVDAGMAPPLSATLALLCLFLPGLLLLFAALPVWAMLAQRPLARRALAGVNAAVVGLLAAAFYNPVWREGVNGPADGIIVAVGLGLLAIFRRPALWAVAWCVGAAAAWTWLGEVVP